jgi:heterodisulfide reductase subunit B
MPILFFTQLMGLAFGAEPHALGIGTELVDARTALAHIGIDVPPIDGPADGETPPAPVDEPRKPPRGRKGPELPMPRMPRDGEAIR